MTKFSHAVLNLKSEEQAREPCLDAAQAWVEVLEKYAANPKPTSDRQRFAATVEDCEKLMDLKPLKSTIRATD